jgi:transposase-like protein
MKSSAVVETLQIAKHDERGRRIADAPEKEALMAGHAASGMTQRAFALREGINPFTFAGWLRQKRLGAAEAKPTPSAGPRFVELRFPGVASGFCLEVVLPSGLIVRGSEAKQLAALVRELR